MRKKATKFIYCGNKIGVVLVYSDFIPIFVICFKLKERWYQKE
ncbi:hypothetical protein J2X31_003212 [Flavobacterium arsenatis]|uniref:Uncharacterized protein n=1 Tax=Flavobacterium arsenatis TaxID=1484332 RepID=A0ABU1TTJ0_9FLAO|nr:hypothetical protein [Flavobacterium arsenatis]